MESSASSGASWLGNSPPSVIIAAPFHGAEDAKAYCGGGREGQEWVTVDRRWGWRCVETSQRWRGARRLITDADHVTRNNFNLAAAWVDEFGAASGGSHNEVTGICLGAAYCLLKSLTPIDEYLPLDCFNASC